MLRQVLVRNLRITLLIGSLGNTGGSERSISLLANSWAQQGRDVTLLTFDHGDVPAYPLHPSIRRINLSLYAHSRYFLQSFQRIFWRNHVLRQAIRESRPKVVISFNAETNVRTILATRGLGVPVIVCERNDPTLCEIEWKWNALRRLAYPLADLLVCQTRSCLARFQTMTKVRGFVVPNLIAVRPSLNHRQVHRQTGRTDHVLVAMGRLEPQKGFDILLRAFSLIAERHTDWSLKILGTGTLRNDLQTLAENLKLTDRVHFAGVRVEPFSDLCHADLFVLSSRFEGFPNALCEAMACGLAAISFDCPSGPANIIRNGVDGILVPPEDVTAMAAALDDLMTDKAKRERMASRAPEVVERFSTMRVLSLWDEIIGELTPTATGFKSAPVQTNVI